MKYSSIIALAALMMLAVSSKKIIVEKTNNESVNPIARIRRFVVAVMRYKLLILLLALPLLGNSQQWVIDLTDEIPHSSLGCGILKDDGDLIVAGTCGEAYGHSNPMLMNISDNGEYNIHIVNDSLFGFSNQGLTIYRIVKLYNNNYLSTIYIPEGVSNTAMFGITIFDENFEIISSRLYEADTMAEKIYASNLLVDDDGTVVLCGSYRYTVILGNGLEQTIGRPFFYRFDEMGDSISCRYVKPATSSDPEYYIQSFECDQIKKDPRSDGFIVFGDGNGGINSVLFYDSDFNYISQFYPCYDNSIHELFDRMSSDTWLADDRMLVFGHTLGSGTWDLMLADISLDGTVNNYDDIYSLSPDTSVCVQGARATAMVNDTTIYGSYYTFKRFKGAYDTRPGVCLFNKNMEVLSIMTMSSAFVGCYPFSIIPLPNGGCVLVCSRMNFGPYHQDAVVIKLAREDLNPIPCGVKEIPQERLQAVAFPNPTHGELNIDISNIPGDTENRVSITDMHGVVRMSRIIRGNGNLLTIDASALEAGTYVYSVFNKEKELLRGKFVKE